MNFRLNLRLNKIYILVIMGLYFAAAYISIQTVFASHLSNSVSYRDGIIYLAIDIFMILTCLYFKNLKLNRLVVYSCALALYQVAAIAITGNLVQVMRSVTWGMLLVGMYQYLMAFPTNRRFFINCLTQILLVLTIVILINELQMRNNLIQSAVNIVYWVEMGLPIAYLVNNKKLKWILIVLMGFAVVLSLKATAILAFFLPLLIVNLIQSKIENGTVRKGVLAIAFLLIIIYLFSPSIESFVFDRFGISWYEKLAYSRESGGSGRRDIWINVINEQGRSTLVQWFMGHGYEGVISAIGRFSAHNDFLEILFDYGILGILLYLGIYNNLIGSIYRLLKKRKASAAALSISLVQMIVVSMFSHLVIYPYLLMTVSLVWVCCVVEDEKI